MRTLLTIAAIAFGLVLLVKFPWAVAAATLLIVALYLGLKRSLALLFVLAVFAGLVMAVWMGQYQFLGIAAAVPFARWLRLRNPKLPMPKRSVVKVP